MNRRSLLISLVLAVPVMARAQVLRSSPPPVVSTGDAASLEMNADYPMPVVQVTIGNSRPLWFGIDTGASGHGRIDPDTAAELGLTVIGQVRGGDPSGLNPQTRRLFSAPGLTLGGIVFTTSELAELPPLPPAGPKMDGILGLDLFAGFVLTFDRVEGAVEVVRGALPEADNVSVFQSPPGRTLRVDLTVGATTITADIDTGHVKDAFAVFDIAGLPVTGEPRHIGTAHTASQTPDIQGMTLTEPVKLGQTTLAVTEATWPSPSPVANLGWAAFAGHVLAVDAANRRVRIA